MEPLTVIPTLAPTEVVEASDAQAARDAALAHIIEYYGEQAPALGLPWHPGADILCPAAGRELSGRRK